MAVPSVGNWVGVVTNTTGTGNVNLQNAIPGFVSFNTVADGDVWYTIIDGDNRETGLGSKTGSVLTRTSVYATVIDGVYSDSGTPIPLSGFAEVYCTFTAEAYVEIVNTALNRPVTWENIQNKPTEYPPETHRHDWTELDNVPTGFNPISHTHLWADITDKPSTFPPTSHTHDWASISGTPATYPPTVHSHTWGAITEKPTEYPPQAHAHTWSQISDPPATYPPSAHGHGWGEITGKPATYPPETHNHDGEYLSINGGTLNSNALTILSNLNEDTRLNLLESSEYGLVIWYDGDANFANFQTRNGGANTTFMAVQRGSRIVDFKDTPTVNGTQVSTAKVTVSTSDPSGGNDGDVWFKVT